MVLLLAALASFTGCIKRTERQAKVDFTEYFPTNLGDYRSFDFVIDSSVVTRKIGNLVTVTNYDSSGQIIGWEDYIIKPNGIYHKNLISLTSLSIHYEPAIPYTPWSRIIGDTLLINAVEIRNDSANTHLRIRLEYEIVALDTITTPAGTFDDCIKVQVAYETLDPTGPPRYDGVSNMWFARGVGLVRYSAFGKTAELKAANIDGTTYPKQ